MDHAADDKGAVDPAVATRHTGAAYDPDAVERYKLGREIGIDNLASDSGHSPISKRLTDPTHGIRPLPSRAMLAHTPYRTPLILGENYSVKESRLVPLLFPGSPNRL